MQPTEPLKRPTNSRGQWDSSVARDIAAAQKADVEMGRPKINQDLRELGPPTCWFHGERCCNGGCY